MSLARCSSPLLSSPPPSAADDDHLPPGRRQRIQAWPSSSSSVLLPPHDAGRHTHHSFDRRAWTGNARTPFLATTLPQTRLLLLRRSLPGSESQALAVNRPAQYRIGTADIGPATPHPTRDHSYLDRLPYPPTGRLPIQILHRKHPAPPVPSTTSHITTQHGVLVAIGGHSSPASAMGQQ